MEQETPNDIERDKHDAASKHLLALRGDTPIATARLTVLQNKHAVLSRVAVLLQERQRDVGQLLVKKIEQLGAHADVKRITLQPHHYLEQFYCNLEYSRFGDDIMVGPHRLIEMHKQF